MKNGDMCFRMEADLNDETSVKNLLDEFDEFCDLINEQEGAEDEKKDETKEANPLEAFADKVINTRHAINLELDNLFCDVPKMNEELWKEKNHVAELEERLRKAEADNHKLLRELCELKAKQSENKFISDRKLKKDNIPPECIEVPHGEDKAAFEQHYKKEGGIEPVDYIIANHLNFLEGNIVKYITRHKEKNGAEDIKKIKRYCDMILKKVYNE